MVELHVIDGQRDCRLQFIKVDQYKKKSAYYKKEMVDVLKRIPSSPRWDGDERVWVLPHEHPSYPVGKPYSWYVKAFADWSQKDRLMKSGRIGKYVHVVKWRHARLTVGRMLSAEASSSL